MTLRNSTPSPAVRFQLTLVIGMLLAAATLAVLTVSPQATPPAVAADTRIAQLAPAPSPTPVSTAPPATAAPQVAIQRPPQPVTVPPDPYANEPVQEIGTVEIPKIGLRHAIFHGITMRNIDRGPSHWPGTAFPGENGNAVFAGHRTTKSRPFRNIDQLVPGDLIHFTVDGARSTYVVTGSEVVKPTQLEIVNPTPLPTATLFACHPPGSAKVRYVVRAALAQGPPAPDETTGEE